MWVYGWAKKIFKITTSKVYNINQCPVYWTSRLNSGHDFPSSATTVRRRPCTTAAGTRPTAPSSASRSTGTPSTSAPAAGKDETVLVRGTGDCSSQTQRFLFPRSQTCLEFASHLHQPLNTFREEILHSSLNLLLMSLWNFSRVKVTSVEGIILNKI